MKTLLLALSAIVAITWTSTAEAKSYTITAPANTVVPEKDTWCTISGGRLLVTPVKDGMFKLVYNGKDKAAPRTAEFYSECAAGKQFYASPGTLRNYGK